MTDVGEVTPLLSVIVASAGSSDHLRAGLDALAPAIARLPIEVIAVSGEPDTAAPESRPGVVYATAPQPSVFAGRALGLSLARGDVVAVLEDHVVPPPDWADALVTAWRVTDSDALVHSISVDPVAGVWERALFTLTFGPFLAVDSVPHDRLPVPGIVSVRRCLLPEGPIEDGWFEYQLLARLTNERRSAMIEVPPPLHVQPVTWRATPLAFHSGRMFAGSSARGNPRRVQLRRIQRDAVTMSRQSVAARRRLDHGRVNWRIGAALAVLIAAHTVGQLVGVITRSPGRSDQRLE